MSQKIKYIINETDRYGNTRTYFRKKPNPRILIVSEPGTPEFELEYERAKAMDSLATPQPKKGPAEKVQPEKPARVIPGSLKALTVEYFSSDEFKELDDLTKVQRRRRIEGLMSSEVEGTEIIVGDLPVSQLLPKHIKSIRDMYKGRKTQGNAVLCDLNRIFDLAIEEDVPYVEINPVKGVRKLKHKTKGHHTWTPAEIEKFENKYPIGTRERLAFALLLYTGQRQSDVIRMSADMVDSDNFITLIQHKNRNRCPQEISIPILEELKNIIDKTPSASEGDVWLTSPTGLVFNGPNFTQWFRGACKRAEVPGRSHGLRKACASLLAEKGCSPHEIMAITGHRTIAEVERYTRSANMRILATAAMDKRGRPSLRLVG